MPTAPCAKLKRPVPVVRSVMISIVNTVTIAPVSPSNSWTMISSEGSVISVNRTPRRASVPKPMSSSGLRPQSSDQYPIHGASISVPNSDR